MRKLRDLIDVYCLLRRGGNGVLWSLKEARRITTKRRG